ncbi:MAG: hypothetical protein MI755_20010 [Sphingomonadales bacterium]|nr:hypothetical protein [Sphingomonadales bacterium]
MPDLLEQFAFITSELVIPVVTVVAVIVTLGFLIRSRSFSVKAGSIEVSALNREEADIRSRIDQDTLDGGPSARQFALLKEYHAQGLAQSKVSFWFSLVFASLGFLIILYAIIYYLGSNAEFERGERLVEPGIFEGVQKPIFALVAGTVIEAVAALFFVQSNKARELMSEFFDKARMDRKLDESLQLASQIDNAEVSAGLKAFLAMSFVDAEPNEQVLSSILGQKLDLTKIKQS